jgi:hypothetical protein
MKVSKGTMSGDTPNVQSIEKPNHIMLIAVKTQFEGFHRWKDAPDSHEYLRNWHRHMFHVEVKKDVAHGNRQIEFHAFKTEVEAYIHNYLKGMRFEKSCEQIALELLNKFDAAVVTVYEDDENGAQVFRRESKANSEKPETAKEAKAPKQGPGQQGLLDVKKILEEKYAVNPIKYKVIDLGLVIGDYFNILRTDNFSDELKKVESVITKKRTKPFFGIEAEGPLAEMRTVFVPCSEPNLSESKLDKYLIRLFDLMRDFRSDVQLYIGAGNAVCGADSNAVVRFLVSLFPLINQQVLQVQKYRKNTRFYLTFEVNSLKRLLENNLWIFDVMREYKDTICLTVISNLTSDFKSQEEFDAYIKRGFPLDWSKCLQILFKTVDAHKGIITLQDNWDRYSSACWQTSDKNVRYANDTDLDL